VIGSENILVYSDTDTPRIRYAFGFVFNELLGCNCLFTQDAIEYEASVLPKVCYSRNNPASGMYVYPSGFLAATGLREIQPEVKTIEGLPVFFTHEVSASVFSFDPFSMIFYLLCRYEEYLPHKTDIHGRFCAENSFAFRSGFHTLPLVNIMALKVGDKLQEFYPRLHFSLPKFSFTPTYDIDMAFAHKAKSFTRLAGGFLKMALQLNLNVMLKRLSVISGLTADPYDNFSIHEELHQQYLLKAKYFVNMGNGSRFDKNNSHTSPGFIKLLKRLAENAEIGLHPSYYSGNAPEKIMLEKQRLETIIDQEVYISRQHFVKIDFPETYIALINSGIREDYSMGYTSVAGFRASVCSPFFFYNLTREEQTGLKVFPFAFMDTMFSHYMHLQPDESIVVAEEIINQARAVKGQLFGIWHNYFMSDNKLRIENYREIIKLAAKQISCNIAKE